MRYCSWSIWNGHYWESKDKLISDILVWKPTHEHISKTLHYPALSGHWTYQREMTKMMNALQMMNMTYSVFCPEEMNFITHNGWYTRKNKPNKKNNINELGMLSITDVLVENGISGLSSNPGWGGLCFTLC